MTRQGRLESRVSTRAVAGFLSAALHVGLLVLVVLSGGRRDGINDDDTPLTQVVFLESDIAGHRDGIALAMQSPAPPALLPGEQPEPGDLPPHSTSPTELDAPRDGTDEFLLPDVDLPVDIVLASVEPLSIRLMSRAQAAAFLERVERMAEELAKAPRTRVAWQQDGRRYDAELVLEPATQGAELDRVIAQISAEDQGRQLRTRIMLKRLPFSYFAQVIDRWDPMVELHDDEVTGRMHINSRFKLLHDSQARPTFLGRVSTAAGGFNIRAQGHGRESEVFREGIETNAGRISLSAQKPPLEQARNDRSARLHELAGDAGITFLADGGYAWHDRRSGSSQLVDRPAGQSVYFIAGRGATVYVKGVVSGRFLVYSPRRIVIEGDLVYARDPRDDPDSDDYLGLVSDKDIVIAPPHVTGPGDLRVHAALYARRRFVVAGFGHPGPATLEIFGSLAAGSMTASEPRYATRIEYDWRFERERPPSFPSTDRFAAEDWGGQWTEVLEQPETAPF